VGFIEANDKNKNKNKFFIYLKSFLNSTLKKSFNQNFK